MRNVAKINYCQTCDSPMLRGKSCKKCFPEMAHNEKPKRDYACSFVENGKRCGSSQYPVQIANTPKENPQFFCSRHNEKVNQKTDVEKRNLENIAMLQQEQKESGLPWPQFYRAKLKHDVKDAAKNLAGVK